MFVEFCVVISPVPFILGSLMGGRIGTLGVGTAKLCTLSDDWDLKKKTFVRDILTEGDCLKLRESTAATHLSL